MVLVLLNKTQMYTFPFDLDGTFHSPVSPPEYALDGMAESFTATVECNCRSGTTTSEPRDNGSGTRSTKRSNFLKALL